MTATDLMTAPAITVTPDTPLDDAAYLLVRHKIGSLPVVDDHGRLLGLVTESDLIRGLAMRVGIGVSPTAHVNPDRMPHTVGDILHRTPATVQLMDSEQLCLLRMVQHDGRELVVVHDGKVVGVVSRRDAIGALATRVRHAEPLDAARIHVSRDIDLSSTQRETTSP